jgi:hypothetical protein
LGIVYVRNLKKLSSTKLCITSSLSVLTHFTEEKNSSFETLAEVFVHEKVGALLVKKDDALELVV